MIRVVLADDHELLREGTRHMLEQYADLRVVGEARTGDEALVQIARHRPDVAVLDIRMPGLNSIEVIRRARDLSPATRCLVLSAYDDDAFVLAAMDAGASGYLLKTVKAEGLASAVHSAYRGDTVLHPDISRKMALMWARKGPRSDPSMLTARELEVLELAARGMRNKDIAQALGVSIRTVEGHFSTILGKLALPSRTAAVVYGAVHGWFSLQSQDRSEP